MFSGLNYKFPLDKKNEAETFYEKSKHHLRVNGRPFDTLFDQSKS